MRTSMRRQNISKYLLMLLALLLCLMFPAITTLTLNHNDNSRNSLPEQASGSEATPTSIPVTTEASAPSHQNTVVYSNEVFATLVNELLSNASISTSAPLETFQIISRDDSGCVTALEIASQSVDIEVFAEQFDLTSTYFEVDEYNGGVRIITK